MVLYLNERNYRKIQNLKYWIVLIEQEDFGVFFNIKTLEKLEIRKDYTSTATYSFYRTYEDGAKFPTWGTFDREKFLK